MPNVLFHPNMSMEEFASALETRFHHLPDANADQLAEIEHAPRTKRGQPVSTERIEQFQIMGRGRLDGSTILEAARAALNEHANANSRRRRTQNDSEDEAESLVREYRRYRKKMNDGLNPSTSYNKDMLIELIVAKQWEKVSAIFKNANNLRRKSICKILNQLN